MLTPNSTHLLSETDKVELNKLVSVLELSSNTTIIFAITPESSPQHPVVRQLKEFLGSGEEKFEICDFFYSQDSFHNFLYGLDNRKVQTPKTGRKLVMAFGIDQLPTPRLVKEMKQLNLGREELFGKNLVVIFWVNRTGFLDEFRNRAPDFWDWRGKVVTFTTGNDLIYPYLDWLIAENSYLTMSGVMQVNRQVDIFLDQIYVSLQAQWRQQVLDTSERSQREMETATARTAGGSAGLKQMVSSYDDWDEPCFYDYEQFSEEAILTSSTKTVTQKVDLADAVRENNYSVILGAPGAGKTTLLRFLALHFATAKRDNLETVIVDYDVTDNLNGDKKQDSGIENNLNGNKIQENSVNNPSKDKNQDKQRKDLGKTLLPVFFRIADYAEQLKQQPGLTLLEYLRQFYCQWEANFQVREAMGTEIFEFLLYLMRQGKCLMLLDGLDEVFDRESRKVIVERINQFVDDFPGNKYVITSRIAGYREVQLSSRFAEFTIEDMDSEQVERFLYRWCRTVEKTQQPDASEEQWLSRGNEQAQDILLAIKDNPGVQRLTANPLLLTILALIHRNGERLPNRRVKLYELAVQTLTEDWQLSKKLPDAPRVVLKETEVVELLAPLAFWMHEEKPSGLVTQAEVEEKLAEKLAELNDTEPESDSVRQAVGEFLRKVRETTGLFVERTPGVYGFMHLTFEEYFVARYIADNDQSEILAIIDKHLDEPRWNEPLLLALGYYGSHFSGQFKKLAKNLFANLEDYQPALQEGEIKIKNSASDGAVILYLQEDKLTNNTREAEFKLRNLLFTGEVVAEVEVNSIIIRKKPIEKLITTYLGIDADFEDDTTKQLLRLLRKIEIFYQKGEVIGFLKEAANNSNLSEEIRVKAKAAILYVACGELAGLVDCVTEIINQLEPSLFCSIRDLVGELGEEMTPVLEKACQFYKEEDCQLILNFLRGISYLRKDKYDLAINLFELTDDSLDNSFRPYIAWSLATCYQEKEEFDKANDNYQECFELLSQLIEPWAFLIYWSNRGVCYRLHGKYEKALDCFQRMLEISREIQNFHDESLALYHIGRTYKDWGKYEQAISYYQQSRELYLQLGKDKYVANQWYWLANCYREWGKYELAIECENQDLAIRQQLDDQVSVALAYYQLGRIYQSWGKYEQAVSYYQQSRDLYLQLGKDKDVANRWYNLASCYREWGKYEQAIECENQDLAIRQQLDDQVNIADAYFQLGRIYKDWGKYEQAVGYYQQSRDLYLQLGKDKDIANLWYSLANCYREWGKYELAIECQSQCLAICQQLDDQVSVADAYFQLGRIYKDWGKYEQVVGYYQQSRDLYLQLGKDKDIANLWYSLANCYREWGKYEQAVEYLNQCLAILQQLDNQVSIAVAYFQLGWMYQGWGKYEQAVSYYQQSRDPYLQLGKDKDVANLWYLLANCYREWGKYEQAVEYLNQCLAIRQQLDDQVSVAIAYYQLGRIYQSWGKCEQAVSYYQQSRDLFLQLGRDNNVANQWYWLGDCYREWGKYELAIECENQNLAILQQLDDQVRTALAYRQLGRIYKDWGKYEQAVSYYQQSRDLYLQLGKDKDIANLWYSLANCYREWGKYEQAVEYLNQCLAIRQQLDNQVSIAVAYFQLGRIYQSWGKYAQAVSYYQQSCNLYLKLDKKQDVAICDRRLASCQCLSAKNTQNSTEISDLLVLAEENISQAININNAGEYKENLAYDYIIFSLIYSEKLRLLPTEDTSIPEKISLFEEYYQRGLRYLDELGQIVNKAEEYLDIARAYLEIEVLENLKRSEEIAQECLQIFQEYNRRELAAAANKLLGEIYIKRNQQNYSGAEKIAAEYLAVSLQTYRDLDLAEKAAEVEELIKLNLG